MEERERCGGCERERGGCAVEWKVMRFRFSILHLRQRSLTRGVLLSLGAMAGSMLLAGFPRIEALHGTEWQLALIPVAFCGMMETARCLNRKWSLYHAGVLILLYSELMILAMVLVLWIYL
jgi:hypothetical protein